MDPAVAALVRAALSLLFVAAAAHKLGDVRRFAATVREYRLVPGALAPAIAGGLVAAEGATAVLLATAGCGPFVAAGLLLVYAGAIALNLARGRRDLDCGCSRDVRPITRWLVARNVALAALALAVAVPVRTRPLVWVDALTVAGGTAVLAALYSAAGRLVTSRGAA